MQLNITNILKHWKLLMVLGIVCQTLVSILFYFLGINEDIRINENIALNTTSTAMALGGLIAYLIFIIILKGKKQA
ncbi:hypothetical protein CRG49_005285 [Neisseria sp. N95_16]|nr:hypothetical protein CRG49_005285 [Neisseria sp. N95_16]PJO79034.1 hypothetical protein CWC45_01790 [Neisseria sp. N177_16]QGL25110.1 hypothetical protein GJV52_05910 [Neisseria brasiliensis]